MGDLIIPYRMTKSLVNLYNGRVVFSICAFRIPIFSKQSEYKMSTKLALSTKILHMV